MAREGRGTFRLNIIAIARYRMLDILVRVRKDVTGTDVTYAPARYNVSRFR
jgi:hypothetical protein